MEKKRVLVTGIGGNVGQGIVRNIRATKFPIKVIGCNVTSFSAGNHLCDGFYTVPYAHAEDYIKIIQQIVIREGIDLIIPSTDYEVYYLAVSEDEISCEIIVSEAKTAKTYLDKYATYLHHLKEGIPFAKSFLPSEYDNSLSQVIVKPREGRGSRGINVNPPNPKSFSDEYMIQELHKGKEVTTAFYVKKKNELHGLISMERSLENGATNECRVVTQYDDIIQDIILKIIEKSNIIGSANLQSIITEDGQVYPFEINCRISGTNSIRSQFGFEDVKYTLQEHLYRIQPDVPKVTKGIAVRILMDVIYPNVESFDKLKDNSNQHYLY